MWSSANVNSCGKYSLGAICRLIVVISAVCYCTQRSLEAINFSSAKQRITADRQNRIEMKSNDRQKRTAVSNVRRSMIKFLFGRKCLTNDLFFFIDFIVCIMFISTLAVIQLLHVSQGAIRAFRAWLLLFYSQLKCFLVMLCYLSHSYSI